MSLEENKQLVYRYFDALNNRDIPALLAVCGDHIVEHPAPHGLPPGLEGFKQHKQRFLAAFPEAHVVVEDVVAEDDRVALRAILHATDSATRRFTLQIIVFGRIADGKFVELWQGEIEE